MKIVSLLHEGSLTGAPIAGLKTAIVLAKYARSEVFVAGRVSENFRNYCSLFTKQVELVSQLNIDKNDLVICHSGALCKAVLQLTRRGFRVLWWIHEDTHLFNLVDLEAIKASFVSAWGIVTVSPHCAYRTFSELTWSRAARNVFIVPNTVPPGFPISGFDQSRPISREKYTAVHIGTLGKLKGTDIVLECANKLVGTPIIFKLFGRVLERDLITQVGSLSNVEVFGEQGPDVIRSNLSSADVLFHPTRLDNQPIVILEALSLKVPVVTSALPSLMTYASHTNGVIYCDGAIENYVSALLSILREPPTVHLPAQFSQDYFEAKLCQILELHRSH